MKYIVIGKNYISPLFKQFEKRNDYKIITEDELEKLDIEITYEDKVYAPSETSIPAVLASTTSGRRKREIEALKNKFTCRTYLRSVYPDFFFKEVQSDNLKDIDLPSDKRFILKPQKGFFNTAIYEFDEDSDIEKLAKKVERELQEKVRYFSDEVFSPGKLLIEEYIEGEEEYAVDVYYDKNGDPVILNIQHHPIPDDKDNFFILHYTEEGIFEEFYDDLMKVFVEFNKDLGATSLPFHAEFKLTPSGELVPIEFNVPRFGGFGFADIPYHAFGYNPFEYYFEDKSVDWDDLWGEYSGEYYAMFLCYNPKNADFDKFKPDHKKMKKHLSGLLEYHVMDHRENPVFAIAYIKQENKDELYELMGTDFSNFMKSI